MEKSNKYYKPLIRENYGGKWVSDVKEALKNNCNGIPEDKLLRMFVQMNIFPDTAKGIIRQFQDVDVLQQKNGLWYWNEIDDDFNIPTYSRPETNPEMKPYLKAKKKLQEEEAKEKLTLTGTSENEKIATADKALYQFYSNNCKKDKEKPISYDLWLTKKYEKKEEGN